MLFERQQYQEDCINRIIEASEKEDSLSLDVLMETGTGKTFTYLKTMYEMNKQFGKNKFLIFVPRIAIRASIIQNIDLTLGYFFQEYGKRIKKHIYEGKTGLNQVSDYIRNKDKFSVLILTSASILAKNKQDRILTRRQEQLFEAGIPLEEIKKLNPTIFFDEPHLLDGTEFVKKYSEYFSDSQCLRFGATFPEEKENKPSDYIYTLDSITAFCDYLVKKISVSTLIDQENNIKFYKTNRKDRLTLHYFKGGVEYKTELKVKQNISTITGDRTHNFHVIKIARDKVVLSNREKWNFSSDSYILSDETIHKMIRKTIQIHFKKEEDLFKKNIKTLSLFFIPSISDFRGDNPHIKTIFEKEYKKQRNKKLKENISPSYRAYLQKDYDKNQKLSVHEGYFSGDRGSKEQKENHGVNLILNHKKKLLSTDEPLRFVFSVWALQEGWDNPNIFNICKLASTDKETKRKQQVGRGLRLAVDHQGKRQTIRHCGEDESAFYSINTLDVIVSGHEQSFIEGIQNEVTGNIITGDKFTRQSLLDIGLNSSQANHFMVWLETEGIIEMDENENETWNIKSLINKFLEKNKDSCPNSIKPRIDELIEAFEKANSFSPTNRNKPIDKITIRPQNFKKFESLWQAITKKAKIIYQHIDDDKIIQSASNAFNKESIAPLKIKIVKETYDIHSNQIIKEPKDEILGDINLFQTYRYKEFIHDFSKKENLPLHFCLKLFNVLDRNKIKNNPQKAYKLISKIIKEEIHKSIIQSISYKFDSNIAIEARSKFYNDGKPKREMLTTELGKYTDKNTTPNEWYLYDRIVYDSNIEKDIVNNDPKSIEKDTVSKSPKSIGEEKEEYKVRSKLEDRIIVFAKLPRISIPTPYKSYSPDFAYYIQRQGQKHLFLIVETKGYDMGYDIPDDEKRKIKYAEKFFKALNATVNNVDIAYIERINKMELTDILDIIEKQW